MPKNTPTPPLPLSRDMDLSLSLDYASDVIRDVNQTMWHDNPMYLNRVVVAAERLLKSVKAARKRHLPRARL